jgi:hypothetical protein
MVYQLWHKNQEDSLHHGENLGSGVNAGLPSTY